MRQNPLHITGGQVKIMFTAFMSFFLQSSGEDVVALIVTLVMLVVALVMIAGMWKIYTKANEPGWALFVPIYNFYALLKIVGRPTWWLLLLLIPLLNVVALVVYVDLAKSFGKSTLYGLGLIFLPFVFMPMLGFGSAEYQGPAALQPN